MRDADSTPTELFGLIQDPKIKDNLKILRLELSSQAGFYMLDVFYNKVKSVTDTFQNLFCLIVVLQWTGGNRLDKSHIYNVLHALFPKMPLLTQLYIYHDDTFSDSPLTLEPLLVTYLPYLKNFENRCFSTIFRDFTCFQLISPQMICTSVTNSKLERLSGCQTDIWTLAKTYPYLKHWSFGIFNGDFVGIEYDNEVTMPSIQSVAIECEKYCSGHALRFHHLNILFKAFPNLLAVRVNCSPFKTLNMNMNMNMNMNINVNMIMIMICYWQF